MYNELIEDIKLNEGFRGEPYNDTEGFPTIGYGTKLPITKEEAQLLLEYRLNQVIDELTERKLKDLSLKEEAVFVLYDMAYNMGVPKLMQFKKMWEALEVQDYSKASAEMMDSKWYVQVKSRAEKLVEKMKGLA